MVQHVDQCLSLPAVSMLNHDVLAVASRMDCSQKNRFMIYRVNNELPLSR